MQNSMLNVRIHCFCRLRNFGNCCKAHLCLWAFILSVSSQWNNIFLDFHPGWASFCYSALSLNITSSVRYLSTQSKIALESFHLTSLFYFHHSSQYHPVFWCLFIVWLPPLAFKLHLIRTCVLFSAVSQGLEQCPAWAAFLVIDPGRNVFFHPWPFCLLRLPDYPSPTLPFPCSQTPIHPSICCLIQEGRWYVQFDFIPKL